MGVKERRARHKRDLRQDILDTARELFVAQGYNNVSMRKIAEKIEYSPTTIYLYFKDKAELLHSLCSETFAGLVQAFEKLSAEETNPMLGLKKGFRAYIEFGLEHPHHYIVTFMMPRAPEDKEEFEQTPGYQAFSYLPQYVGTCVATGQFRPVDVAAASQTLWAATHGLTSLLIMQCGFPWAERTLLIDTLIDTLFEGLKA